MLFDEEAYLIPVNDCRDHPYEWLLFPRTFQVIESMYVKS